MSLDIEVILGEIDAPELQQQNALNYSFLKDGNTLINAIGFNMGYYADEFLIGDKIDVVGNLELNKFNGITSVQINMKDIRKSY